MSNPSEYTDSRSPGSFRGGDFTLVEHPEHGDQGLAVRPVTAEQERMVRRWGGYLFATASEAEEFAKAEMTRGAGSHLVRQTFSHKRVDGLRIYVDPGVAV